MTIRESKLSIVRRKFRELTKRWIDELMYPNDQDMIIRIMKDNNDKQISDKIESLPAALGLDIEIN